MNGRRLGNLAADKTVYHLFYLLAHQVRRHADDAVATYGHEGKGISVIAAPYQKIVAGLLDDSGNLLKIAARFLHPDDVVYLAQPDDGLGGHVDHGARRHVVHDAGQAGAFRHRPEVLVKALLDGLVIVRHHQQAGVNAYFLRFSGRFNGFSGAVAAGASDNRPLAADGLFYFLEKSVFLRPDQRGRFPGGADHQHAITPRSKQGKSQLFRLLIVYLPLFIEWGNHGGEQSSQLFHLATSLGFIQSRLIISSAIWTAFNAAPLRRLSATIHITRPLGWEVSRRMRPTNTSSVPAAIQGCG